MNFVWHVLLKLIQLDLFPFSRFAVDTFFLQAAQLMELSILINGSSLSQRMFNYQLRKVLVTIPPISSHFSVDVYSDQR